MSTPLFIVFEGIDGSGTTTQVSRLKEFAETACKVDIVVTREPGGTPLAERIRQLVLDPAAVEMHDKTELLLYAASRNQHVNELIAPALKAGKPVLCDRFIASSMAYQGYGRGLDLELVEQINDIAVGACLPDLTIFLDLPVEVASERRRRRAGEPDRMEGAGGGLQEKVAQAYRNIAILKPQTSLVLDATQSAEVLADEVRRQVCYRWSCFPFKN